MKERLDVLLVKKGFFTSRERAQATIMAGVVFVDGIKSDKAGTKIDVDAEILVKEDPCPYVSRGGFKLEKAISEFDISLDGKVCLDIGASTGGFTDCMLQNGAEKVYAVDVGYGQLAWKLRTDERVVNIEKCNVRYLETDKITEQVDFISIDVSFISLKLILPVASKFIKEDGSMVCLIKPQFESTKEEMKGTNGIIKDPKLHVKAIEKVLGYAKANKLGFCGLSFSPVKGTKGNIEYLLYLNKIFSLSNDTDLEYNFNVVNEIVEKSHNTFNAE